MTIDKGAWPHLATIAKDEKIWFPMTVLATCRCQDQIRYGDPEKGVGQFEGSGFGVIKILKMSLLA